MAKTIGDVIKRIKALDEYKVSAGVLGGATYPDTGKSVAEVAIQQEFGTSTIPPRPFLRTAATDHRKDWTRRMATGIKVHLRDDRPLDHITTLVGGQMAADIKETIKAGVNPPISEVTKMMRYLTKVEGKKRNEATYQEAVHRVRRGDQPGAVDDTPLYDTHMLYNSISYE